MNGCMRSEDADSAGQGMPCVPMPMVCVAFVLGATLGVVFSRKREMMHGGMRRHHHHGEGSPACREWHGEWPNPQMPPAEEPSV
jgi:hypothetical protein